MWELLKTIALCTKKLFTEWLPTLLNADLGPIGEMKDVIGIIGLVLIAGPAILKYLRDHGY